MMTSYYVVGSLQRQLDGALEGWCRAPDRPGARLTVEILADDTVVGTIRADSFRRDLERVGFGDGRHAFKLPLGPGALPAEATLLSARETGSGRIFGRVRLRPNKSADSRLERLADALDTLRALLPRPPSPTPVARPTQAGFRWVGARLANAAAGPAGAGHRLFLRGHPARPGDARGGNSVAGPRCGVMIWARRADAAARAAAAIRPAVRRGWAALVIVDSGADPATSFLPGVCPEATYLRRPHGFSLADAAWEAAAMTTAPCLVLIGDTDATLSSAALDDIVDSLGASLDSAPPQAEGFLLAVNRETFRHAGGLDQRTEDSAESAAADFALRAALLGARTLRPSDPASRGTEADP